MVFKKDGVIKNEFHKSKQSINFDKVDIRKIVISSKDSYGKKSSFVYVKYFHSNNKYMNSLVHDIKLSKTTIQYGIILVIYLEKGFVVSQYVMMNTLKLK